MPGNVPNISADTFNFVKAYKHVTIQQGVPIVDSDWNELQTIIIMEHIRQNISNLGDCRLAPGPSSDVPGFRCEGNGSPNNFRITAGLACIKGLIVPSEHGVTEPQDYVSYDGWDNHMMEGTVTGIGSGTIEDENTRFETFMDLVGCRILMTSGAENGSPFTVLNRVDMTNLELAGGIGAIAPGDTYRMLPPSLTTPVASRSDEVYIMAWFDDINSEEDPDLLNPALSLEPSHRLKIRACVRVAEGGTTPVTPDPYSMGVRYMRIAVINRNTSMGIQSSMVEPDYNSVMKRSLSGGADFFADAPNVLWRNLGWPDDVDITSYSISLYQWGPRLICLVGAYFTMDGHVHTGPNGGAVKWYDTDGNVMFTEFNAANTDIGDWTDDSTWAMRVNLRSTGVDVKLQALSIWSQLQLRNDVNMRLYGNAHIVGDPGAVDPSAEPLFEVAGGFYPRIWYTDQEIWFTLNTNYDESTGEFVSYTPASGSYLIKLKNGAVDMYVHGYSTTPWTIGDWSNTTRLDASRVSAQDVRMTRVAQTYTDTQERVFSRYPGFLMVRMEHSTQGTHVAMFRTEDFDSFFEMVSGNSGWFDPQYNHANTVNVYPSGSSNFLIQNNIGQSVDISYSYIRLEELV